MGLAGLCMRRGAQDHGELTGIPGATKRGKPSNIILLRPKVKVWYVSSPVTMVGLKEGSGRLPAALMRLECRVLLLHIFYIE